MKAVDQRLTCSSIGGHVEEISPKQGEICSLKGMTMWCRGTYMRMNKRNCGDGIKDRPP